MKKNVLGNFYSRAFATLMCSSYLMNIFAAPVGYSNPNGALNIKNKTSSTVLADSLSKKIGWVLPPSSGSVEAKNFLPSTNLGFCKGLKELTGSSTFLYQSLSEKLKKLPELERQIEELGDKIFEIDLKISNIGDINQLNEMIQEVTSNINEKKADITTIQILINGGIDVENNRKRLLEILEEIKVLELEKKDYTDKKAKIINLMNEKNFISDQMKRLEDQYYGAISRINQLQEQLDNAYKNRAKIEGGYVFVDYDTKWESNLKILRKDNPGIDFKQIPTKNARLLANFLPSNPDGVDSYFASLPILLDYSIAGISYTPWGKSNDTAIQLNAYPNTINGNMRLSLLGGCPIVDKNFFTDFKIDDVKRGQSYPVFGIHAMYDYSVVYNVDVYAKYNLYTMYTELIKKVEKRGFLSRKVYSEHILDKKESSSLKIIVKDSGNILTVKEKMDLVTQIKNELYEKILGAVAYPVPKIKNEPNVSIPQGKTGAAVLGEGFLKTCGHIMYCQAAGWVFMTVDAMFGSKQAEANYKESYNRTVEETFNLEHAFDRTGSAGFDRAKDIK